MTNCFPLSPIHFLHGSLVLVFAHERKLVFLLCVRTRDVGFELRSAFGEVFSGGLFLLSYRIFSVYTNLKNILTVEHKHIISQLRMIEVDVIMKVKELK